MPKVNLELQLKFLNELEDALMDALSQYAGEGAGKLAELKYMQREVERAKRVIAERQSQQKPTPHRFVEDDYREVAFS